MSSNMPQARQPKGRPTGGEFAETRRASAGIQLDSATAVGGDTYIAEQSAYDPAVSTEELNQMLDHSQPVTVRAAAARTPYPGVARVASRDPSPLVRALALDGWDLPEEDRKRLEEDDQVAHLLSVLRQ